MKRALPVAAVATALPIIGSSVTLIVGPMLAGWLRDNGVYGACWFVVVFVVMGAFAVTPTYTSSVIAGWAFGFRLGITCVITGAVGGALLCFYLARKLGRSRIEPLFAEHPRWDIVRKALIQENARKALGMVFLLRLSPALPFGTTNVLLATTGVNVIPFIVGTTLGLLPRLSLVTFAAARAEQLDFNASESWWILAGGICATLACIAIMGLIGKHALERATRAGAKTP